MQISAAEPAELAPDECYALLRTVPVGRLVATEHALPLVLPVQFAVDGTALVVRTAADPRLVRATSDAVVSLQADRLDEELRFGWSVVVTGLSCPLTAPEDLLRATSLRLGTWSVSPSDNFVRISPGLVTGRRLRSRH